MVDDRKIVQAGCDVEAIRPEASPEQQCILRKGFGFSVAATLHEVAAGLIEELGHAIGLRFERADPMRDRYDVCHKPLAAHPRPIMCVGKGGVKSGNGARDVRSALGFTECRPHDLLNQTVHAVGAPRRVGPDERITRERSQQLGRRHFVGICSGFKELERDGIRCEEGTEPQDVCRFGRRVLDCGEVRCPGYRDGIA